MPNYHIYFISSLPMLHFGVRPPFSFEHFLRKCAEFLPEADAEVLKNLPAMLADLTSAVDKNRVIKEYLFFDAALRNELVKIRAQRKHIDAFKYQRPTDYSDTQLAPLAIAAYRNPLAQDAEKALDEARWQFLDGLCLGHYFDPEFLIIYAYKLKILERWERARGADKAFLLEENANG